MVVKREQLESFLMDAHRTPYGNPLPKKRRKSAWFVVLPTAHLNRNVPLS
jgi:hypothetical protein